MDVMETQYKDVQGKENKEDVVKLIEIVVEEYVKDPWTFNLFFVASTSMFKTASPTPPLKGLIVPDGT